jgi:hypothetical protein
MTNEIRIDGVEFNVQNEDVVALAQRIYEDGQAGRPTPLLQCTHQHRGIMHLRKVNGKLWAAHNPGQGGAGCSVRFTNEGPGHRAAKNYAIRAWIGHGYTAVIDEHTVTGTDGKVLVRHDAAVLDAPAKIGFEAQFSPLTPTAARARTTKSYRAGWTALWLPGSNDLPLAGYHGIPMARPHTDIAWAEGTPRPGTVHVLSKRPFVMEPCTVRGRFTSCPDTGRGPCGGFHPFFPAPDDGFDVLDEVLGELAAGLTVPLLDAKGVVRLVTADDYRRYEELTGLDRKSVV